MSELISPFEAFCAAWGDSDAESDEDVSTVFNNGHLADKGSISTPIIDAATPYGVLQSALKTDDQLILMQSPFALDDSPVGADAELEPYDGLDKIDVGPRHCSAQFSSQSSKFEHGVSGDHHVHVLEDLDVLTKLASSWESCETSAKYVLDCVSCEVASTKESEGNDDDGDTVSCAGWKLQRNSRQGAEMDASLDATSKGSKRVVRGAFLGKGSFGHVYEASVGGERRAMKTMSVDFRMLQRAVEEAEVGCKMYHPNIARTFSYTVSEDCADLPGFLGGAAKRTARRTTATVQQISDMYFKVELEQELCDLGPLHRFITTEGFFEGHSMPKEDCIALLSIDVARALMHLEERGVTHNDLSSKNVLLATDPSSPLVSVPR